MPFIGNQPAQSYTSFAKQDFTTSATTSYTLDYPVANENEIALFINFVRQEPTTAYTASGTSLTLTSATSASDDMYAVFIGKAVQTITPLDGSITSAKISYPLTNFTSTGIDDNATSTAITIDSSENVGIGTASPSQKLDVNGNLNVTGTGNFVAGGTRRVEVSGNGFSTFTGSPILDGGIEFTNQFGHVYSIGVSNGDSLKVFDSGTELLRVTPSGVLFNGAGSYLDDYEEGTFNVTFTGSNSGSFTFSNAGRYTKIGRLVTISVDIGNQAFGSYDGSLQFSLPFTSGINTYYGGDAYYYPQAKWDNVSNFIGFTPNAPQSSNIGTFQLKTLEGDRQANLTNSNTNTSGQSNLYVRFSLTYATA